MPPREKLAETIKKIHGCTTALYLRTVPVKEVFKGETVFDGDVSVFAITGHPKAAHCYAWGYEEKPNDWHITAVLEIPPVDSPQTAVKVAVAAYARQEQARQSRKP